MATSTRPASGVFGHGAGEASVYCENNFVNLPHPHNDYIRFLYDFGAMGLVFFLIFVGITFVKLFRRMNQQSRHGNRVDVALCQGAILALIGVLASMATDNSANYLFVMSPLAVLIGAALSVKLDAPKQPFEADDGLNWVFHDDSVERRSHPPMTAAWRTDTMDRRLTANGDSIARSTEPYA